MPIQEFTWSVKNAMGDLCAIKGTFERGEDENAVLAEARRLAELVRVEPARPAEPVKLVSVNGVRDDQVGMHERLALAGLSRREGGAWVGSMPESDARVLVADAMRVGLVVALADPDPAPPAPVVDETAREEVVSVLITGTSPDDTETHAQLKAHGLRWDPQSRAWIGVVPRSVAAAMQEQAGALGLTVDVLGDPPPPAVPGQAEALDGEAARIVAEELAPETPAPAPAPAPVPPASTNGATPTSTTVLTVRNIADQRTRSLLRRQGFTGDTKAGVFAQEFGDAAEAERMKEMLQRVAGLKPEVS